jgi:hypothetical protein
MDVGCCCVCVTTVPPMRNPICFGERAYGRSVLRSNQKTQLRPWAALAGMSQLGCLGSKLGMGKWTVEMWASDARTPMIANTFMHCNHYIADS